MGVGTFAGDRRLRRRARLHRLEPGAAGTATPYYAFIYNAGQHDTDAKEFTFPIYPNGSKTIPARARRAGHAGRHRPDRRARAASGDRPAAGAQAVCASSSAKSTRRTRRCISDMSRIYYDSGFEIKPMLCAAAALARSSTTRRNCYKRYSWPVEFVVRSLKEVGLERLLGERCADAARRTWGSSSSSRRT